MSEILCRAPGCDAPPHGQRKYCAMHRQRLKKFGVLEPYHCIGCGLHLSEGRKFCGDCHRLNVALKSRRSRGKLAGRPGEMERRAATVKQWRQDNPEKYREQARAYKLARKARERGARTETVLLSVLIERDRARCQICGKVRGKDRWSIDHIVPLSKGGANTYANTQLAHIRCNRKRWNVGPAQLRMFGILG